MTKQALGNKMNTVAWALFLVMIGGLWLVPEGTVPESTWLLGVGLILLGLNLARAMNKLSISWFIVVLGVVAVVGGIVGFMGLQISIFPLILIVIGITIILETLAKKETD
ncbi:MAG: hypothetical protein JW782_03100 [Candidatus Saganbacteria bacterium]|nr:hypothetical protein [Candidatus Saganbacteria bacterium]